MKNSKAITRGILLPVLGICGLVFLQCSGKRGINWATEVVERSSMSNMVTATGTVEPVTQVEVGTQVSGIIDKIYVDYNSVVKKGQLLAEMDKVTLQAELQSNEAQLASAKAEYDYQQKNYARSQVLFEKKLISDTDYETSLYNYEKAKSAYEKSQADIVKVRRNLGYTVITSPIDGVVISREVEEGQTVAAGFETPTLFNIANDLTEMQVIADVDEADIGQVAEGQRVTFEVDAYPNDVFEGIVTQVRLEATVESNVVTYEVVISAPNPDLKLKPGLTATVTIYTLEKENVLAVSSKALKFIPDEIMAAENKIDIRSLPESGESLRKTLWIKKAGLLEERKVKTGTSSGSLVEIIQGVSEGEEVVTGMEVAKNGNGDMKPGEQEGGSPFMPTPPGRKKKN
ncbi:efflux RND transporter periplasmic adaptor subunit [Odoribacter lunatus]|uniref:efflux RND transporter periplasmic adaptor subunit n=1 Tax=Odoribacter lunatus TaxID=2941335 RepID=UPI00203B3ACC|nr:efflux RND transporter periplasmic adaptor subunit [Odoribacter lunatus]